MPSLLLVLTLIGFHLDTSVAYASEFSKDDLKVVATSIAVAHDLDVKRFLWVIDCESKWDKTNWNKKDPNDGSKGILQFQQSTFNWAAKKYGMKNPDVWNPLQQFELAADMFADGQSSQWTCARMYDKRH